MDHTLTLLVLIGIVSVAYQTVVEVISQTRLDQISSVDEYLNICLDGMHHKKMPGPETELFAQCSPWRNRSCCTQETVRGFHLQDKWYNFNWNHCPGLPLSPACRAHFIQDLCFYECSPNTGPWLKPVNMKIRSEKFYNIPLCKSECDLWWHDCQDDYTCLKNWAKGFNWTTGTNVCPEHAPCQKFNYVYENAKDFCESIWDSSWLVVDNDKPCMKLWFDADGQNPNDHVARLRAEELINQVEIISPKISVLLFVFFLKIVIS